MNDESLNNIKKKFFYINKFSLNEKERSNSKEKY